MVHFELGTYSGEYKGVIMNKMALSFMLSLALAMPMFAEGFSGKWDCGILGTLSLKEKIKKKKKKKKVKVTGSYNYVFKGNPVSGKLKGKVKNGILFAKWKKIGTGKSGRVEFTLEGDNIKGRWRMKTKTDWSKTPWNCSRK